MFLKLFLAFSLVPVAELYLLVLLGGKIGALNTIAVVILTGVAGAWLARQQGLGVLARVRGSLAQGVVPAAEMLDGLFIVAAGVLLLTPGFLTDLAGIIFLLPQTRAPIKSWLRLKMEEWLASGRMNVTIYR